MKPTIGIMTLLVGSAIAANAQTGWTPVPASYAQAVMTNNPCSFWLINETTKTSNSSVTVIDYANGNDGTAGPAADLLFLDGPASPCYPGFPAANTAIGVVQGDFSFLNLPDPGSFPNSGMTICGWVYAPQPAYGVPGPIPLPLICDLAEDTDNPAGYGLVFSTYPLAPANMVTYQWGFFPSASGFTLTNGIVFNTNEWTFVALVVGTNLTGADLEQSITADTNATIYVGSPSLGLQSLTDSTALDGDSIDTGTGSGDLALGSFASVLLPTKLAFYGANTVAYNAVALFCSALSPQTITNLYLAGAGFGFSGTADPDTPGNLLLSYPIGILQGSPGANGPFTDVPGAATPYSVPMTNAQYFYRVRNPGSY